MPTVGHALPTIEIIIGVALILGLLTRLFAVIGALFFLAFIIGIASAWARGLEINCGCFGSHGVPADPHRQYAIDIARDIGLLICCRLAGHLAAHPLRPGQPAVPASRKARRWRTSHVSSRKLSAPRR